MENQCSFAPLVKETTDFPVERVEEFFFRMRDFKADDDISFSTEPLTGIGKYLTKEHYFIARNVPFYKGRQRAFGSDFAIADRESLTNFLIQSQIKGESRNLLISPVFETDPECVIQIYDEIFWIIE